MIIDNRTLGATQHCLRAPGLRATGPFCKERAVGIDFVEALETVCERRGFGLRSWKWPTTAGDDARPFWWATTFALRLKLLETTPLD